MSGRFCGMRSERRIRVWNDMKNAGYLGNFCPDNLHSFMIGLKLIQQKKCFSIYGLSILLLARTHPMSLLFY
jgi:hypothetical protein